MTGRERLPAAEEAGTAPKASTSAPEPEAPPSPSITTEESETLERDSDQLALTSFQREALRKATTLVGAVRSRLESRAPGRWLRLEKPGNIAAIGGMLAALVLGLWLTAGAWGDRPPAGDDTMAHLARTEFALDHIVGRGRLDGWQPTFILGYQAFLFLGPVFTWAVGLLQVMSLGLLSVAGAFKVATIASFVALPLAVAFLVRSLGLGRRAAGIAAVLTLCVSSPFGGVGLQGLFGIGLVPNQLAAVFAFLALGGMARVILEPGPRWMVFTGVTLAAVIATHGITAMIFVILLLIMAPLLLVSVGEPSSPRSTGPSSEEDRRDAIDNNASSAHPRPWRQPTKRLIIAGALGLGLAGFIVVPVLAHLDLRGPLTGWANPPATERLAAIWRGEILFRPGVAILVLAGMAYCYLQLERGLALVLIGTPIAFLAIAYLMLDQAPSNVVSQQLANRGLGYVGVLAVLPLAVLVAHSTARYGRMGDILALAAAVAVVLFPLGDLRNVAKEATAVPQMHTAAQRLETLVPDGARFATQRDFPEEIRRTGVSHPDFWLAAQSGRNTLNAFNVESSTTFGPAYETDHMTEKPPDAEADALARLGVTHVVLTNPAKAQGVLASPRFPLVWESAPLAIVAVSARPDQPHPSTLLATSGPTQARLVEAEPEHLVIDARADQPVDATIAVAWSPKWDVERDGRGVPLRRESDGLLKVSLPAGTSRLTLDFRRDVWDWLGLAVTLSAVIGAAWFLTRGRRAPTSSPGAPWAEEGQAPPSSHATLDDHPAPRARPSGQQPEPVTPVPGHAAGLESDRSKVMVVMPAYNAARTLAATWKAIPSGVVDEVLLVDDGSYDATLDVAARLPIRTIALPHNVGYGSNQKTCYLEALRLGADTVVMLHPDGQYDPALLPDLIAPIIAGQADMVLGSRMLTPGGARAGRMPLHRYISNKALTAIENKALRASFSELHTGYRAYSRRFLETVPFMRNSNDFVFDTQLIAQALAFKQRIVEVPIHTRYFSEASSTSMSANIRYAIGTLAVMARYRLHQAHLVPCRLFRP